jgi:hypothetical protein
MKLSLNKRHTANNQGVVLVMTLVIMSLIMISVLAFSKIITGEVKMAINTGNVVVSYYAAESGIEKGLFSIKYSREVANFSHFTDLETGGDQIINNAYIKSRKYEIKESIINADDYIVYDLSTSTPIHVDIIDPAGDLDGIAGAGIDWDSGFLSTYQYKVNWMIEDCFPFHASDRLEISVTSFDSNFLNSETEKHVVICDCGFASDDCNDTFTTKDIVDTKFYRFSFRPLSEEVDQLQFNVYRNATPIGILSEASIESHGTYANSSYYIKARIPSLSPLSDVFSYVLFSEEDLTKGI